MEGERATTGRTDCWRGVRAEISISRSNPDRSGVWGSADGPGADSGERWEGDALLDFLDIDHGVASVAGGFGPGGAVAGHQCYGHQYYMVGRCYEGWQGAGVSGGEGLDSGRRDREDVATVTRTDCESKSMTAVIWYGLPTREGGQHSLQVVSKANPGWDMLQRAADWELFQQLMSECRYSSNEGFPFPSSSSAGCY